MYCATCGHQNPDVSKFCMRCGAALQAQAAGGGRSAPPEVEQENGGARQGRRGMIAVLLGLAGLALVAGIAVVAWLFLRGDGLSLPGGLALAGLGSSEELVVAFPDRDGVVDLYLLELGQAPEDGVLLAEDVRAAEETRVAYWPADRWNQWVRGDHSAFFPESERLLLYYHQRGDEDVVVRRVEIGSQASEELIKTNALPLRVTAIEGSEALFVTETRDGQERCYVALPGASTTRLIRGDACAPVRDGTVVYQRSVDPDNGELTLAMIDTNGAQEMMALEDLEDVASSDIRITDDGSHVLYVQAVEGGEQLFIIDVASGTVSEASAPVFAVVNFEFVPGSDDIFYLAENDDGFLDLYVGASETPLATAFAVSTSWSKDGRTMVYNLGDEEGENACYRYDVSSGESRSILAADNLACFGLSDIVRVLLWEADEDELIVRSAPLAGGEPLELLAEDDVRMAQVRYLYGGERLFLMLQDTRDEWSLFTTAVDEADGFYLLEGWKQLQLLDMAADGSRVILSAVEDEGDDPVLMSMALEEGQRPVVLDDDADSYANAFFTRNGRDIVYTAVTGPDADDVQVVRVRAAGEEPGEVLYDDAAIDSIRWGEVTSFHGLVLMPYTYLQTGSSLCPGAPVLAKGSTVQGNLAEEAPACFRLSAQAGDILTFEVDTSTADSGVDTTLTLRDRDGEQVGFNDDSMLGRDPRLTATMEESGVYFVQVDGARSSNSDFALTLQERTDAYAGARALRLGDTWEGEITGASTVYLQMLGYDGFGDLYSFEGEAGERVVMNVAAGSRGSDLMPWIVLLDEGQNVVVDSGSGNAGGGAGGRDARLVHTLGSAGRYYVMVTGTGENFPRGDNLVYQLALQRVVDGFSQPQTATVGGSVSNAVTADAVLYLADHNYEGYGHLYAFEAQSGERVRIDVRAGSLGSQLAPSVVVFNSERTIIAEQASEDDTSLVFSPETSGTYYVAVIDWHERFGEDFAYEMSIATAEGLESLVIPVGGRSVYSGSNVYYADIDRVAFDAENFYVYFESHGRSDLRRPESSCVVEQPGGQRINVADYDTPVRQSTNYRGVLIFPLDSIEADAEYYFRYSCSGYSDVFLFDGSLVWP